MKRYSINMFDSFGGYTRISGFRILSVIPGLLNSGTIAVFCPIDQVTETIYISSSGPKPNTTASTVKTTVTTNVVGDQTVKTVDVNTYVNQDETLQSILAWLKG